jgi:hypothetical protein
LVAISGGKRPQKRDISLAWLARIMCLKYLEIIPDSGDGTIAYVNLLLTIGEKGLPLP